MMIHFNVDNPNLWCIHCKERIRIGEKYVVMKEEYNEEVIEKVYHLYDAPTEEDFEEPYISGE